MNSQTVRQNHALLQQLASCYVLGTLRNQARRRFEAWLAQDSELQHAVADWQDRLAPLAELVPAVGAPDTVWQAIEHRLQLAATATQSSSASAVHRLKSLNIITRHAPSLWQRWSYNLSFWRGLGLVSSAMATVLFVLLIGAQLGPVAPLNSYVALLSDANAKTVAIVSGDAQQHQLTVKFVQHPALTADQSLQLWAVPTGGTPRSLGVLAANGVITLPLPADATPASIPLLAISLEPKGGSPNPNGPSGPILFKGDWVRL